MEDTWYSPTTRPSPGLTAPAGLAGLTQVSNIQQLAHSHCQSSPGLTAPAVLAGLTQVSSSQQLAQSLPGLTVFVCPEDGHLKTYSLILDKVSVDGKKCSLFTQRLMISVYIKLSKERIYLLL